ncbi:MAG: LuxR C-terminal-related transcriptional regulator [Bacteroidales bacterium]|nr:LuxR C-terminal-related transcriptional regulator [Bacteroidales bacterium]
MNRQTLEIAILDNDTLAAIGLRSILADAVPDVAVRIFTSFAQYVDDTPEMFVHTFVSERIYLEYVDFFVRLGHRVIVLASGEGRVVNAMSVDVSQNEKGIICSLLNILEQGHHSNPNATLRSEDELSPREIEVLALIARGFMNKEIAETLNIGLTTVISHRKNIQDKLHTKSVSGLTIYAVLNGYVDLRDI